MTTKCLQPRRSSPNIWKVRGTATPVRGATVPHPPAARLAPISKMHQMPRGRREVNGERRGKERRKGQLTPRSCTHREGAGK